MAMLISKTNLFEKPSGREKLVFALTMAVFFGVFMRTCWSPSSEAVRTMKSELAGAIEEKKALELAAETTVPPSPKDTVKAGFNVPLKYEKMAALLAENPDTVLMTEFSNPAVLRDVKLTGIELSDAGGSGGAVGRSFKMSLFGSFTSVGGYLGRLEGLPLLLIIDNIAVIAAEGTTGRVTAEFSGVVYGWKESNM